jgi:hypothetical protein
MRVYEGEVRLPRKSLRSSGLRLPRDVDQSSTSVAPGCPGAAVLHSADTGFADAVPRSRRAFRASFNERPALERQRAPCDPKRDAGDPQERAQGKPGARCTRGLMCHDAHSKTHTSIQVQRKQSGLPCAMVLTAYAVLSSATNSFCRRHRRIRGFAETGWIQKTSADLTPATGVGTTRFCRPRAACAKLSTGLVPIRRSPGEGGFSIVRLRAAWGSQILRPALPAPCTPDAAASTASHPNVRDDGQRPS